MMTLNFTRNIPPCTSKIVDEKIMLLANDLIPGMIDATRNVINNEDYYFK